MDCLIENQLFHFLPADVVTERRDCHVLKSNFTSAVKCMYQ